MILSPELQRSFLWEEVDFIFNKCKRMVWYPCCFQRNEKKPIYIFQCGKTHARFSATCLWKAYTYVLLTVLPYFWSLHLQIWVRSLCHLGKRKIGMILLCVGVTFQIVHKWPKQEEKVLKIRNSNNHWKAVNLKLLWSVFSHYKKLNR